MCVISQLADPPEGKRGMSDVSPLLVVVPTLLYGAETWVLYWKKIRLLEQFHKCCLRSILGINWQEHKSNKEVLKRASLSSIESILLQVELRWAVHVTRMEDVHMPKAVFFSEL